MKHGNRITIQRHPLAGPLYLLLAVLLSVPTQLLARDTIFIKGGSITGLYFGAASTLCEIVNGSAEADLQCAARGGPGSAFNIHALQRGVLDFGIVQADRQWEAWVGRVGARVRFSAFRPTDWPSAVPLRRIRLPCCRRDRPTVGWPARANYR